ncbi:uncharacterized protein Z520_08907 [Fonsecaea multimorphosa CBS 102226]|uniref:FAM192A/Fyv6 N-terminal domain-containing protein n=1 Tax=Fonsecaea multimorphosa CBS 102226 TaxID=1442371 RepID=A0A0D2H0R3_9EURO|nr:uncharacterized protein Z520_08907 [Fonsecaea multimorphosa CBS 102226]KIX95390.1 hypothetical protein Z520_08907 [Fonsecaea multimorphosa CBS 102226]OAL21056.1 hypothetical protein AYO22_08340 [Fonsecaea multimorphosa]
MSRFVPAGTDPDTPDDAWVKAQQQVESTRKPKTVEGGAQEGGKSLYEVLQANKAAKQEAFEESVRLKNQFRALDDDEVEFLDSVLESSRAKENAVKQETAEQLEVFRKQRAAAEQALMGGNEAGKPGEPADKDSWAIKKKKRRREKNSESEAEPKLRKLSAAETAAADDDEHNAPVERTSPVNNPAIKDQIEPPITTKHPQPATGLGLVAYSSDEDE